MQGGKQQPAKLLAAKDSRQLLHTPVSMLRMDFCGGHAKGLPVQDEAAAAGEMTSEKKVTLHIPHAYSEMDINSKSLRFLSSISFGKSSFTFCDAFFIKRIKIFQNIRIEIPEII